MKRAFLLAAGILCAALPAPAVDLRLKASTTWAENISRSSSPLDGQDALIGEAAVSARLLDRQLASGLTARAEAEAGALASPRFSRLNQLTLGARGRLQYKFGLGPFAPVVQAEAGLAAKAARVSAANGGTAAASLGVAKRLTESWRIRAAGDWQRHYGRDETFDTLHRRLAAELTWDITPQWQLTYGFGRLWGDFTASASAAVWDRALAGQLGAPIAAYYNTVPRLRAGLYAPGWVSYRVHGEADLWWLELSPALTDRTSLSLRYDHVFTVNRVNVRYRQDLWTLGLLHAF